MKKASILIQGLVCTALLAACGESGGVSADKALESAETKTEAAVDNASEQLATTAAVAKAADHSSGDSNELVAEAIGLIETLPETYPPDWILIQDGAFFHMLDGRMVVVDASSDDSARRFKGMFNTSLLGHFAQSTTRPEMYVSESFLSRGSRGERIDVLTIYDKRTLAPIDEVMLPPKRSSNMPTIYNLSLVDNEKLALSYNFTPAASVSVIDLDAREHLGEIPVPGCALAYPMTGRGFSTICADGALLSVQIGASIDEVESQRTEVFFDYENDPLMEKAVQIGGTTYFPSFMGNVYPVDMSGDVAVPGKPWSLLAAGDEGWRPGGLQSTGTDDAGRFYILMHPEGYEGSHKDPGVEVWVFDPKSRKRLERIALRLPAISIGITRGSSPLMVSTNIELGVDVYDIGSGKFERTLDSIGTQTPFMLHGAR